MNSELGNLTRLTVACKLTGRWARSAVCRAAAAGGQNRPGGRLDLGLREQPGREAGSRYETGRGRTEGYETRGRGEPWCYETVRRETRPRAGKSG